MHFFKKHISVSCKPRDRKATETSLVAAANRLFAQKGFENTRTLDIAKEAGVNEALIGRYFGGKEGLLTAVLLDSCNNVDAITPCDKDCTLLNGIKKFFKLGRAAMKENESFMRISHSRALIDEAMSEMVRSKIIEQRLPVMEQNLKTYFEKSKLKKSEVRALAMILASTNFSMNFMGRIIYKMDDESIDLALGVLAEALNEYVEKRR